MSRDDEEELERCRKRVGTTLRGKWHVDELIGIGGMAAVYAATHKMGRRDAIKVLHPHVAKSKELRARFEQEAKAISALGHPGVVKVLDIDATDDGRPFMVMELLSGRTLGELHAELGPRDVLVHMERVLDVLGAAHAQGIVHRDIKPDNLFLTDDGRLLVLDFGIARMKTSGDVQTRLGAMLGTTSFMAPEQIQGRNVDGRADLFSVGATMFRLLSKQRIHDAETDAELVIKMGTTPAPSLRTVAPRVDPSIAAIVDRALAFDKEQRYPDASSMRADVRAVLGLGPAAPHPLGHPSVPPPSASSPGSLPGSFVAAPTQCAPSQAGAPTQPAPSHRGQHGAVMSASPAVSAQPAPSARTATATLASAGSERNDGKRRAVVVAIASAAVLAMASMVWIGWAWLSPEPPQPSAKSVDEDDETETEEEEDPEAFIELSPSASGCVLPLPGPTPQAGVPGKPKPVAGPSKKPNGKKPKKKKDD